MKQPLFLNTERISIIVVGSGEAVSLFLESLEEFSFKTIQIFDENNTYNEAEYPQIIFHHRAVSQEDLANNHLMIISTDDYDYEEQVVELAHEEGILTYVVGKPEISDFSLASLVRKGTQKFGILSENHPVEIRKRINKIVENSLPDDLDEFVDEMKFVVKNPLMNIGDELQQLDKITAEYLRKKQKKSIPYTEIEQLSKVNKAVQRRANIYLGIIGVMLLVGIFSFILYEFSLFPDIKEFMNKDNGIFYKMLAVGFVAEIIAGSMGMGYGVICTTILLLLGVSPPVVSASIHSAETFTSAAGSISHYKLKNVNMKLVKALAIPAIVGAVLGALALTYFGEHYAHIVKPLVSCYTLYLGLNILKSAFKSKEKRAKKPESGKKLRTLGLVGGFIDSFVGGGWGPLVTGTLMKDGRTPRYVVGSSTFSKFLLTITSAVTFIFTLGVYHANIVLGLLIGGIVTAPFSAMLTAKLPVKKMFIIIGFLVCIMSLITIVKGVMSWF